MKTMRSIGAFLRSAWQFVFCFRKVFLAIPVIVTAIVLACRLIVMNTASIQLIPANVAAVRAGLGCAAPFDILPAVWVTSLCSVCVGLLAAFLFQRVTHDD